MILLIDNYDSFTYNLYHLFGVAARDLPAAAEPPEIRVIRNDELTVAEIAALNPTHIVISPGPGKPSEAGVVEDVVRTLGAATPILGVCLGHQAICEAYGGVVSYAKELVHGKPAEVALDTSSPLFTGLPGQVTVARYHSLAAIDASLPATLRVTARTADGEIMAVQHTTYPVYGVQFHPESIMTPTGGRMAANFLRPSP